MDQAASSDQSLLRHDTQCCQNPSVGRDQRLRARHHPEKGIRSGGQYGQNSTGFECQAFLENTRKSLFVNDLDSFTSNGFHAQ
jgi:hypothetical protein